MGAKSSCNLLASCVAAMAFAGPVLAQPAISPSESEATNVTALEEIVVTAARQRNENVQSVPLAVTALDAAHLERNQVTSLVDVGRMAPGLVIVRQLATAAQASIYLRGFGNESNAPSIDPPIAVYVDGIYQPQSSGTLLDLFDVDTIEVERGPQGTLLGKNAPTGAIVVQSRRPRFEFGGQVEASYERFNHREVKALVNIPVVDDVLAIKVSSSYKKGGNFIRSLTQGGARKFGGEDVLSGRLGILFTPTDRIEWLVSIFADRSDNPQTGNRDLAYHGRNGPFQGDAVACTVFGHCTPTRRFTTNAGWVKRNRENQQQISSQLRFKSDAVNATFVTGYKRYHEVNSSDVDGEPEPIIDAIGNPMTYHQFSQEVRLNSVTDGGLDFGGKLDWVIGAFYSKFDYTNQQTLRIFGSDLFSDEKGKARSKAVFAHLVYSFTDRFNVTVGARQSWDRKWHEYVTLGDPTHYVDDPISFRNFSFEAGVQYRFASDKQAYFRYAEGYRAGGFQGLPSPGGTQIPYNPETVKTYEIGFKGDFLDRRLRANISAYLSDYSGLQRTVIAALTQPPFYAQVIRNAADARVKGVEVEVTAVASDALTINGSVTYLDARYRNYVAALIPGEPATNNDDFPFPYASKWTFKVGPQYVVDIDGFGRLTASADATHASRYYPVGIPYPAARVRPLTLVNARIKFEDPTRTYWLTIYGQNLTNKHYIENFTTSPTGQGSSAIFMIGADARPTVYGVTLGARF